MYLPQGEPSLTVLLCQGLSGDKSLVLPDVAAAFASAGFASLAFDYRGFGASEGERGWVDPFSRLSDAHDAFDFLQAQSSMLPAVYGLSLGGGIAYALASQRPVKAVAVTSGFASGERLMRGLTSASAYLAFKSGLASEDKMVPITELFPFSKKFFKEYSALPKAQAGAHSSSIPAQPLFHLSSGSLLLRFDCLASLRKISPAPLLIQHGDLDDVVPIEDVLEIYRAAGEPKKLVVHAGYDHVGLDTGPGFDVQVARAVDFFKSV
ncbi:MAG TPA: alpha/beta fold hydrolase [Fimbriimonas sp.]|nr:alpha/beta fold hydrolase [Fimbriimonas sp.]